MLPYGVRMSAFSALRRRLGPTVPAGLFMPVSGRGQFRYQGFHAGSRSAGNALMAMQGGQVLCFAGSLARSYAAQAAGASLMGLAGWLPLPEFRQGARRERCPGSRIHFEVGFVIKSSAPKG